MFKMQFSLLYAHNAKRANLKVGTILSYRHYGLTKSGCPRHACIKEIFPNRKSLGDFAFGQVVFSSKAAKCCICLARLNPHDRKRKKQPRIEIGAIYLNKLGRLGVAPKPITANFCLSCAPQLFGLIFSFQSNTSIDSDKTWYSKYLLPNTSTKLFVSNEVQAEMEGGDKQILNFAAKDNGIHIVSEV